VEAAPTVEAAPAVEPAPTAGESGRRCHGQNGQREISLRLIEHLLDPPSITSATLEIWLASRRRNFLI